MFNSLVVDVCLMQEQQPAVSVDDEHSTDHPVNDAAQPSVDQVSFTCVVRARNLDA